MQRIIAGVHQFRSKYFKQQREFFEQLAQFKQRPEALFITCSDSRINPNLITQTEPGELFIVRNAGNIVPTYGSGNSSEAGTIEYAVSVLGIRKVIICGHAGCGAIAGLLNEESIADLPAVRSWFLHAEATRRIVQNKYRDLDPVRLATAAAEENVLVQLNNLSTHPTIAALLSSGELQVFGWYYDIAAGSITQFDQSQGRFIELGVEALHASPLQTLSVDPLEGLACGKAS